MTVINVKVINMKLTKYKYDRIVSTLTLILGYTQAELDEGIYRYRDGERGGPFDTGFGLCWHLPELADTELQSIFELWPLYSGDPEYPVHDTYADGTPKEQYHDRNYTSNHYRGVDGKLRLNLAEFILAHIIEGGHI